MQRFIFACAALCFASPAIAQAPDSTALSHSLDTVVVTATRTGRGVFDVPQPVTLLESRLFRERLPNGVADLFRDFPGLDASGVGPNQRRPEIRGLRGQRILLLQDGLRLNNSRRQQDFGELPALAGMDPDRVEVVRGPSSVLYGSDAIGGVVNIISRSPSPQGSRLNGELQYRYGSAGSSRAPSGFLAGQIGGLALRAFTAFRDAGSYRAPSGSFGDITLDRRERVHDSGIRDESYGIMANAALRGTSELFARANWYKASDAGFGFVDPSVFGPGQTRVQITYPEQSFARQTIGFRSSSLPAFFADRIEVSAYSQQNDRSLDNNILVPAGPRATIDISTWNFSDLATTGVRLELARSLGLAATLTYGFDAFRDRSQGTDSSRTVITGFGPTMTEISHTPQIPNAVFTSAGVFAQLEANPVERLSTIVGARYQGVTAATRATDGLTRPVQRGQEATVVWSADGLYRLAPGINLVTSIGRGFRAANLIERFFEGMAPEGGGYQQANPDLSAETSINADVGVRFRRGGLRAEGFAFRNSIRHAISTVATGDSVNRTPAFRNENLDQLRIRGIEASVGFTLPSGLDAGLSASILDGNNVSNPESPVGDSFSSKLVADAAYRDPAGRFSLGYTVRHQGEQSETIVGTNPLGPVVPSFTTHSAMINVRLFRRGSVTNELAMRVENISNVLYAEFPNASFFRPEPERNISVSMILRF